MRDSPPTRNVMMRTALRNTTGIALLTVAMACSSVGRLEDADVPGLDSEHPSHTTTYADLLAQEGKNPETPTQPERDPVTTTDVGVYAVSTCHGGELDYLRMIVESYDKWTQQDSEDPDPTADGSPTYDLSDVLLTLEADTGEVLGSRPLLLDEMLAGMEGKAVGEAQRFAHPMEIRVSDELADAGPFRANLFVCLDTNGNAACADEVVDSLDDMDQWDVYAKARMMAVMGFIPFEITVSGDTTAFHRLAPDGADGAEDPGTAARWMQEMIRPIDPSELGISEDELAITLAAVVHPFDPECGPEPRTDGCFVEGTEIEMADGRPLAAERIQRGMRVKTADGRVAMVQRVITGPEPDPVVEIRTESGRAITVTRLHPMLTRAGVVQARALRLGDELVTEEGDTTRVSALASQPYSGMVFNFRLSGEHTRDHLVIAAGLVTGDLVLQQRLAQPSLVAKR